MELVARILLISMYCEQLVMGSGSKLNGSNIGNAEGEEIELNAAAFKNEMRNLIFESALFLRKHLSNFYPTQCNNGLAILVPSHEALPRKSRNIENHSSAIPLRASFLQDASSPKSQPKARAENILLSCDA